MSNLLSFNTASGPLSLSQYTSSSQPKTVHEKNNVEVSQKEEISFINEPPFKARVIAMKQLYDSRRFEPAAKTAELILKDSDHYTAEELDEAEWIATASKCFKSIEMIRNDFAEAKYDDVISKVYDFFNKYKDYALAQNFFVELNGIRVQCEQHQSLKSLIISAYSLYDKCEYNAAFALINSALASFPNCSELKKISNICIFQKGYQKSALKLLSDRGPQACLQYLSSLPVSHQTAAWITKMRSDLELRK